MSRSTFYADGFNDCIQFNGFLPPDSLSRFDGEKTDVYRAEYTSGYEEGTRVIAAGRINEFRNKRSGYA